MGGAGEPHRHEEGDDRPDAADQAGDDAADELEALLDDGEHHAHGRGDGGEAGDRWQVVERDLNAVEKQ